MAKVPASALTVFTLDTASIVCKTNDVTVNIEAQTEDGSCINDVWESQVLTGKRWSIEGSGLIDTTAFFTGKIDSDPVVTIVFTSGAKNYTGTGILTRATHGVSRRQLQTESFTIAGQGALTIADPS